VPTGSSCVRLIRDVRPRPREEALRGTRRSTGLVENAPETIAGGPRREVPVREPQTVDAGRSAAGTVHRRGPRFGAFIVPRTCPPWWTRFMKVMAERSRRGGGNSASGCRARGELWCSRSPIRRYDSKETRRGRDPGPRYHREQAGGRALQKSEAGTAALFNGSADGILIADIDTGRSGTRTRPCAGCSDIARTNCDPWACWTFTRRMLCKAS